MIVSMGKFTAIGMRTSVKDEINPLVVNTCAKNDTAEMGTFESWVWCNPTNRAITHQYAGVTAVSLESLWQACKILTPGAAPRQDILDGNWRAGKGKKPIGAWAGVGQPLITNPGEARRKIYIPAFKNLIQHWMASPEVQNWIQLCKQHPGPVFLRDHDTGRGLDRNGPLSHAWLFCEFLNNGVWPN